MWCQWEGILGIWAHLLVVRYLAQVEMLCLHLGSCSYCKFRDFHSLNVCLLKKYFGCICSVCVCVYVLVCCRARGTSRISTLWSLKH